MSRVRIGSPLKRGGVFISKPGRDQVATLSIESPPFEFRAFGVARQPNAMAAEMPAMEFVAYGGGSTSLSVPINASFVGVMDAVAVATLPLPTPTLSIAAINGSAGTAAIVLPGINLLAYGAGYVSTIPVPGFGFLATGTLGTVAAATIKAPPSDLLITALLRDTGVADLVSPPFDFSANLGDIGLVMPMPELVMVALGAPSVAGSLSSHVMNVSTGAVTSYSNFTFDYIIRFKNGFYGVKSDGLYLIDGATDSGSSIAAHIKTPKIDFGTTKQKRVPYMYAGSDADFTVTATVDGVAGSTHQSSLGNKRVRLAKGPRGRYWEFNIANVAGGQLQLDRVELLAQVLNRKV